MTKRTWTIAAALALVLVMCETSVRAQIATDRPGFIASTVSVPAGTLQLELGALFESAATDVTTLGEGLVRWGVTERLELRAVAPNYVMIDLPGDETLDGFSDVGAGIKYQFGPLDAAKTVDMVAVASLSIPTGDDAFTSDGFDPELLLAISKSLGSSVSLAAQAGAGLPTQAPDDDREFVYGFAVGTTTVLGSIGVFVEIGIDSPQDDTWPALLHTGFVFPLGRMAQIDIHGAIGLSDASADSFIGAGFSFGG